MHSRLKATLYPVREGDGLRQTTKDLSRGEMFWEASFTIIIDSLSQKFMPIHSIFTYYRTAILTPPVFNSKESYPPQIRLFETYSSRRLAIIYFPKLYIFEVTSRAKFLSAS